MRVLLVYPNVRGMNMLPPSLALFSALLKERGHKVALFDSTDYPNPDVDDVNSDKQKEMYLNCRPFDDTKLRVNFRDDDVFEGFVRSVNDFNPDLIGVTVTEDMFPLGITLLSCIRDRKIPTILGGVFATFAPKIAISPQEVTMVCVGEGEHVLTELCERMDKGESYDNIPGLWVKKSNGTIRANPMAKAVDMNENPLLDLSIFNEGRLYRPMEGKVWRMFPLETHRGCPYRCAFCNSPSQSDLYKEKTGSSFFRKKSVEMIRKEIIHFRDNFQAEAFYFWADTFFAYKKHEFDEFVEMYSEFKIPFWCQTRPETVTEEKIKKLQDVGLFRMAFGIEHGNEEFRKLHIKRDFKNDNIVKALDIVAGTGVNYSVNNILGFPHETRELTFDTIELNRRFPADSRNAYSFAPFHGTPLRDVAEKEGYIPVGQLSRSLTRPTILNMPQYPAHQIEGMRRTFNMYVNFPKSRWPEIEKAEALTVEGDKIWENLRDEMLSNEAPKKADDKIGIFEKMALGTN